MNFLVCAKYRLKPLFCILVFTVFNRASSSCLNKCSLLTSAWNVLIDLRQLHCGRGRLFMQTLTVSKPSKHSPYTPLSNRVRGARSCLRNTVGKPTLWFTCTSARPRAFVSPACGRAQQRGRAVWTYAPPHHSQRAALFTGGTARESTVARLRLPAPLPFHSSLTQEIYDEEEFPTWGLGGKP